MSVDENPLLKPCLLSLAAQYKLKDNNGIMTEGLRFARVRSSKEDASKVLVQEMDVNFLTRENKNGIDVDSDIMPYLNQTLTTNPSKEELMKIFRNINIVSYCDGDCMVNAAIQRMRTVIEERGYSSQDIDDILKNIVIFSFAKNSTIDPAVTSYTFFDVLDNEGSVAP